MALMLIHLLALLVIGYSGITLAVYWILDAHYHANETADVNTDSSSNAHNKPNAERAQQPALLLRGGNQLKGATEQELVKRFAKVDVVKPVEAKLTPPQRAGDNEYESSAAPAAVIVRETRRFPQYGTSEYFQMCPYMEKSALPPPSAEGCSLIVHPRPDSNEGLAAWASSVVQGHLTARQTGCRFLMDYGPGVAIDTVITPPSQSLDGNWSSQVSNWAIPPSGFPCDRSRCAELHSETLQNKRLMSVFRRRWDKSPVYDVPKYRYSYVGVDRRWNGTDFDHLAAYFPGWDVRLGAACSMQMLFQPSHGIVNYEPNFFSKLLPRLRDDRSLVISLYVRVGFADKAAVAEKNGKEPVDEVKGALKTVQVESLVLCTTAIEEEILAMKGRSYDRVVWLVVSDSLVVKEYMSDTYGGKQIKTPTKSLQREIIHTTTNGMHTRPKRGPNTLDFASAFLDFYLLGEADVVINTGGIYSFGVMASLRTARPLFTVQNNQASECSGSNCYCRRAYDASDAFAKIS